VWESNKQTREKHLHLFKNRAQPTTAEKQFSLSKTTPLGIKTTQLFPFKSNFTQWNLSPN
jgi:hypothetical protein